MAVFEMSAAPGAGAPLPRLLWSFCIALIAGHVVFLVASYMNGTWLIDRHGGGVPSDFVDVYAAGRLVLAGHAVAAYDWPTHKLAEEAAVGHSFDGYFGWHYPPPFLFVAGVLALLPYAVAYLGWALVTFPAYLAAIRAIIGDRIGYLLAAAFPAVLANFFVGQNGFLSAALIGGSLFLLPARPLWSGALIGLLTYKPHLGLLFPLALAAGGYWRSFAVAAIVAALMEAASWLAFGNGIFAAFAASIPHTSHAFLSAGWADFSKLQTAFGLARMLGASERVAWTIQIPMALAAALATVAVWRSQAAYELKAAALSTALLLATPYLYTYDVVILAVPLAFLVRFGRQHGFLPHELPAMAAACLLILSFPFCQVPVGLAAILIVAGLIARRVTPLSARWRASPDGIPA